MKTFISGPITGNPNYREDFANAEAVLNLNGFRTANPTKFRLFGLPMERYPWGICMAVCLWHLFWCPRIYMLHGWGSSRGSTIEHRFARFFNKRVIYQLKYDY
jgi:hypothetical protein